MNKFMNALEKFILPLSNNLSANKVLQGISKGLMSLMPVFIGGAVAAILANLPIDAYQGILASTGIGPMLNKVVDVTTNMLAVYATFAIAYTYVKNEGGNAFAAGLISLISFMIVTPTTIEGEGWGAIKNLPFNWLGAKGLFVAMLIAILTGVIYTILVRKNITIRMPDSVPEFVSKSFGGIVPAIIILALFVTINLIVQNTSFENLHQILYTLIGKPLTGLGTSLPAVMLVYVLTGLCWFFGVHGIAVVSVFMPIWMAADAENLAAFTAGVANSELPHIITNSWINTVSNIGGAGASLGLMIWIFCRAKSEQNKTLGKLCIVPGAFCINEPLIFGMPVVLNTTLLLPFVFTQPILIGIAYFLTKIGILARVSGVATPAGTPLAVSGLLTGGWTLVVWQIVAILISLIVYYPFFKILDKQALEEEKAVVMN